MTGVTSCMSFCTYSKLHYEIMPSGRNFSIKNTKSVFVRFLFQNLSPNLVLHSQDLANSLDHAMKSLEDSLKDHIMIKICALNIYHHDDSYIIL